MPMYSTIDFSTDRIALSEQMERLLSELHASVEAMCRSVTLPKSKAGLVLPNAWSHRTGCFLWHWCALLVRFRNEGHVHLDADACLARIELGFLRGACSPGGVAGDWEEGLAMRKYMDKEFPCDQDMESKWKYSYTIMTLVRMLHSYVQHVAI